MFLVDWFYGILASLGERPSTAVYAVARRCESNVGPEHLLASHTDLPFFPHTPPAGFLGVCSPTRERPPQPADAYLDGWLVNVRPGEGGGVWRPAGHAPDSRKGGRFAAVSGPKRFSAPRFGLSDILRESNEQHARDNNRLGAQ